MYSVGAPPSIERSFGGEIWGRKLGRQGLAIRRKGIWNLGHWHKSVGAGIIEGTVVAAETNSGAGMRAEFVQAKPKVVTAAIQEDSGDDDDDDVYADVVFTQTKMVQVHKHKVSAGLRNQAITMLKKKGKALKSHTLELAAMQMAADPFAKIKGLLQGLIERLLKEATDEATQKGWSAWEP